jgi:hypothetical protein
MRRHVSMDTNDTKNDILIILRLNIVLDMSNGS